MTTEKKKGSECNLEAPTTSENNCILYSAAEPDKQANELRMVDHALAYAARGWHVFPAHSSGEKKSHKSAAFSNGRAWGATTNAIQIKRDFARWPNANIGIATVDMQDAPMAEGEYVLRFEMIRLSDGKWLSSQGDRKSVV